MIGLERFSLYQNEDELKADLEQTNLVNCLSWNFLIQRDRKGEDGKLTDKFMNEMLPSLMRISFSYFKKLSSFSFNLCTSASIP